jgi:mono/diheme cytochrome c family protein
MRCSRQAENACGVCRFSALKSGDAVNRLVLPVIGVVVAVVIVGAAFAAWRLYDRDEDIAKADVRATPELIARGEYLVKAADCAACHNAPGGKPFTGGLSFKLPFGTIYSTNITADKETGIGAWSDDDLVRALHQGIAKDGSHLYPAFPYTSYTGLSRDDIVAIKAYLFSLPAVRAPAHPNELPFPFNQRWTMAFWNLVFLDQHRFHPDPLASERENRGQYLATALGHCGECHTPRNIGFAMALSKQFSGAMLEGWHAYNITADKTYGIGEWSDKQIGDYLSTGHAADRGSAAGPMAEAIANSLQYLTNEDVESLVAYLRRVEPKAGKAGAEVNLAPAEMIASKSWKPSSSEVANLDGQRIFEGVCAACHQWNGGGRQTPYASLAGSQAANDPDGVNLVRVMLTGADLRTAKGRGYMPSFGDAYSDAELAAVANYVIGHFGGKSGDVTAQAVRERRAVQ